MAMGNYDFCVKDELVDEDEVGYQQVLRGITLARKANYQVPSSSGPHRPTTPHPRAARDRATEVLGTLDGFFSSSQIRLLRSPSDQYHSQTQCTLKASRAGKNTNPWEPTTSLHRTRDSATGIRPISTVVNGTYLVLKGCPLGQLHVITYPFELFPCPDTRPLTVPGTVTYQPTGEPWKLAYWGTMHLDVATEGQTDRLRRLSNSDLARIMADCAQFQSGGGDCGERLAIDYENSYLPRWCLTIDVISELERISVFRTSRGYLGLTLSNVAPTDEVFLLLGFTNALHSQT
ncbi:hypothetical protein B0H67DRAFT_558712 [Lasiosphaeris hirsuta]|uniref:Uncharacterized protein n=1 Tax=Lasiosphaeris hirsuta TaxID=260670 RepID=A0AA39ZPS5_9PEZI|nr:hypothetical protein B0H67DRAFT_558712 [Lasiosphaeris hirsuta]